MPRRVIMNTPLGLPLRNTIIVSIHYIKAWRTVWVRHTWKHQQCMTALSALHKEWSCRKEEGSTTYWPECAARDTLYTNSRHEDQRSATGCKEEKIYSLDFCLHSKWRKIKAHQCNIAHGRSTAKAANMFTTILLTCKLQGQQCWEELGLDFLPSINKGNVKCSICWLTVQGPQTEWFLGNRSKQKIPLVPKNQDGIKRLGWCCLHVLLQINRGQPPLGAALSVNYFSFTLHSEIFLSRTWRTQPTRATQIHKKLSFNVSYLPKGLLCEHSFIFTLLLPSTACHTVQRVRSDPAKTSIRAKLHWLHMGLQWVLDQG